MYETVKTSIEMSWAEVLKQVGYDHDGKYNLSDKPEVAQKLGAALFDYVTSSAYDNDWNGFSESELVGISSFLFDLSRQEQ